MMISQGMIIGERYKIIKLIGDGGMARVYLANDLILNRHVAIKILRHELADDSTFIKRFEREARAVTSLSHPNIVGIYDIGSDNGSYYIVMEYIEGKTLKHLIKERGALNVTETLALMKQITNGVAHAHNHGIIHRDLKPQNILLKRDGTVKITDFGIALTNSATSITKTNSIMGSVHYLAPEIARGEAASVQSDIYALGIIMYEMMTGELPFKDSAPVAIVMKHMREPFPSVRDFDASIPQSIENTITLATAKSKRNRLRTARELYAALTSALNSRRINEQRIVFSGSDRSESYELNELKSQAPEKVTAKAVDGKKQGGKKKKLRIDRLLAIAAVFIATLIILIIAFFAMTNTSKPKTTIVPNVTDKTVAEAKSALESSKLKVDDSITYEYSDNVAKDKVIKTNPPGLEATTEGTNVQLTVSKGAKFLIKYDQIIGKTKDEVQTLLETKGFKPTYVEEYSNDVAAGKVISISVADNSSIDDTTRVEIKVSKGAEQVEVPDFSNLTIAEAEKLAESRGLVFYYNYVNSSKTKGTVVSQPIAKGEKVDKGASITVAVSSGPAPSSSGSNGSGSSSGSSGSSGSGSSSGSSGSSGSGSSSGSSGSNGSGSSSGTATDGNTTSGSEAASTGTGA